MELNNIFKLINPSHSYRTSDHFHVDICDFNEDQINNLFRNSLLLENTLYNFGTTQSKWDRKTNAYCMPVGRYLISNEFPRGWEILELPKYLGFRFTHNYGTIEYRMFNSVDSSLIEIARANTLLELVENSKKIILKKDFSNIKELLPRSWGFLNTYYKSPSKIELEFTSDYLTYLSSIRKY